MSTLLNGYRLVAAIIAGMYLLALFPTPEFPVYNSDDGSYFVTLALNLLDHSRYSVDTWPGTVYGHHATWPPLHPLLLAAVIATAGHSWAAIKVVMAEILGLLGLYLWFRLFRPTRRTRRNSCIEPESHLLHLRAPPHG